MDSVAAWLSASVSGYVAWELTIHLDKAEPLFFPGFGLFCYIRRSVTTTVRLISPIIVKILKDLHPAVNITSLSDLAAEQFPDGNAEDLALDIPKSDVHTTHGRHKDFTTSVESMPVKVGVDFFNVHSIPSNQSAHGKHVCL